MSNLYEDYKKRVQFKGKNKREYVKTKVTETNKKSRYITLQDKTTPRMFNNLELAKITAGIIMPGKRFEYYIKLSNNTIINMIIFLIKRINVRIFILK